MGNKPLLAIAGNIHEFKTILKCNPKIIRYVNGREQLYGIRNPVVILCGSFWRRPDWEELEEHLKMIEAEIVEVRY